MKLFHVTARRNAEAILAEGLRTDADHGWDAGYIWGFDSLDLATEEAKLSWGLSRGDNVIFEIDAAGLPVVHDPHQGWGDWRDAHAFAVPQSIEPERIRLLEAA